MHDVHLANVRYQPYPLKKMSKPGGTPIPKRRPFYRDKNIALYTIVGSDSKIVAFEFEDFNHPYCNHKGEISTVTKITRFNVKQHKVLNAWQELQAYADPIVSKLLNPKNVKQGLKSATINKSSRLTITRKSRKG